MLIILSLACKADRNGRNTPSNEPITKKEKTLSTQEEKGEALLQKCLNAHGGQQLWNSFNGLAYKLNDNGKEIYQLTHLKDRRTFIKSKEYEVGFDGKVAWAKPNAREVSGGSAAFYYNLDFYFLGIPFLLKDPGVNIYYEGQKTKDLHIYEVLKITFGPEVGLTPGDIYYLYIDLATHMLKILTYSISYFDEGSTSIKSAKIYSDYRKVQGLQMPHKMENFVWKNGELGKSKNHLRFFDEIKFLKEIPDESVFEAPNGAVIEKISN